MSRDESVKRHSGTKRILIAVPIIIVAAAIAALVIRHQQTIVQAFTLATTHQPERFTQLSFNNTGRLPLYAAPDKTQSFTFHIANHEAGPVAYHYLSTLTAGGTTTVLGDGTVLLNDSQTYDKSLTFVMNTPNEPAEISVWLLGRNEHIGFRSHS